MKIGLALGGGVARGTAHVGVLTVLEREGIPIDCVSGTSAGSVVGAAYCAGFPLAEMRLLALQTKWWDVARLVWPRSGFVSFAPMEKWIENLVGPRDIRDLPIPFATVATDLESGCAVTLSAGRLATAVRASCSVPGFVTPVKMNGYLLGDGGVADNLPVAAVRSLGADYVIGVDLFEPAFKRRLGPLGPGLAAMETLIRQAGGGIRTADCLITPNLSGLSYFRFSSAEQYIKLGEAAAEEALPELRAALKARHQSNP